MFSMRVHSAPFWQAGWQSTVGKYVTKHASYSRNIKHWWGMQSWRYPQICDCRTFAKDHTIVHCYMIIHVVTHESDSQMRWSPCSPGNRLCDALSVWRSGTLGDDSTFNNIHEANKSASNVTSATHRDARCVILAYSIPDERWKFNCLLSNFWISQQEVYVRHDCYCVPVMPVTPIVTIPTAPIWRGCVPSYRLRVRLLTYGSETRLSSHDSTNNILVGLHLVRLHSECFVLHEIFARYVFAG